MNSTEVIEQLNGYSDLYNYLSVHTGSAVQDPDDVQSIYSTLKAEVYIIERGFKILIHPSPVLVMNYNTCLCIVVLIFAIFKISPFINCF